VLHIGEILCSNSGSDKT